MADILTKSQFADRLGRHPSQVTRWIEAGKLSGDAVVGEGRNARINLAAALRQLNITLDLGQQLAQARPIMPGQNVAPRAEPPPSDVPAAQPMGDIDPAELARREEIALKNARLRQQIERGAREDAVAAGQLVDMGAVRTALARQLQPLGALFDQLPPKVAKAISEQHGLPYTDVLITVRNSVRGHRVAMAETVASLERSTTA
jgi:hypothetical protein